MIENGAQEKSGISDIQRRSDSLMNKNNKRLPELGRDQREE